MSFSSDPANPYQSPEYVAQVAPAKLTHASASLPPFCMVVFILDLVLLAFRAIFVLFGFIGMAMVANDPMVSATGPYEIAAGAAMVLFGFPAAIAMLMKQRWGVSLAVMKILATLGSCVVAIWQATFVAQRFQPGSPEMTGFIAGYGVMFVFRLALIGLYVAAVIVFYNWVRAQRPAMR